MVSCTAEHRIPANVPTVIIGNGPSALALSFLLHGNVPYYDKDKLRPHYNAGLHQKLATNRTRPLYTSLKDVNKLCEHLQHSGGYSEDAWPINVLLNTLLWPNADFDPDCESTLEFVRDDSYAREHVVLGSEAVAGGQWAAERSVTDGENARTLSYSEQLSLPGYSFAQFVLEEYGHPMSLYERPRRPQVSAYYAAYASRSGLSDSFYNGTRVTSVIHLGPSAYSVSGVGPSGTPFTTSCQNLVLACGLFTHLIDPPHALSPYVNKILPAKDSQRSPILIIGSGFSAADAIVENLGKRPVVHVYKWDTSEYISPLKHCHRSSYPEYAEVYRRMKLCSQNLASFEDYRGIADGTVGAIAEIDGSYEVYLKRPGLDSSPILLRVGEIAVLAGRRTSLDFLEPKLLRALKIDAKEGWLERTGLRDQITPDGPALTVDQGRILCIGSITGDSLVKFMFGAVIGAASKIIGV